MLLVCSTYMSVMWMYCVLFDLRRKLKIAETSVSQNLTLQLNTDCHNITDDYNLQSLTVKLKK